jgi:hypothetical protein
MGRVDTGEQKLRPGTEKVKAFLGKVPEAVDWTRETYKC